MSDEGEHYTCTECRDVSDQSGVCKNEDCLKEDQALTPCTCTDGEHGADEDEDYYAK